ncbi:M23 family metallopeptidase [Aureibaculum sp. A20]|uniref:M23 family metallopeptidase n=1 Tax=Aureibaculum flavum TaxID=2795986 RepID=A0ABS0WMU0_9FLAO|nr:M23 family metallopeptidase [Aureibaculum flavum]MBJ2173295.1 M23 family metallopeptidase [Aureibaculum flavum]
MKKLLFIVLYLMIISCSKEEKRPDYVTINLENDSIYIEVINPVTSTSFLKIENLDNGETKILDFDKPDTLIVLKFHKSEIDTAEIFKNYKIKINYGSSVFTKYDSLYNYGLPFLKGKRFRVLQGQNSSFTHNGQVSSYAIDFKMDIGQEVCAIREGVVVYVKNDSDEGGSGKEYKSKANSTLIFHNDGTFSQYAHFKKNGIIVKKGDTIKKGQLIGYSGNTGQSTEPHLHFVVYKPTINGLASIPYILDSIPTNKYKTGRIATNN